MKRTFYFTIIVLVMSSCSSRKSTLSKNVFESQSGKTVEKALLKPDGSSFLNAVVVESISEEYKYIRANCNNCKFMGQALVFDDKKPYDILTVENEEGKKVKYYFDISSFYGKGFD